MIDTIVLNIPITKPGTIRRPEYFLPNLDLFKTKIAYSNRCFLKATQNPSRKDLSQGIYKPRLTFIRRPDFVKNTKSKFMYALRIEFSAPKLLFGNNFDELEDADFPKVLSVLETKLISMGINISTAELSNADISAIHYSKNIVLDKGTTVPMVLEELKKVDLNQKFDLDQTKYRNSGESLRYHSNSSEIIFYNKIEELRHSKLSSKRALEKDGEIQLGLFDELNKIRPFDVFRMEVRLGKRVKIKQVLKIVGYTGDLTFEKLFKKDLSQKILLYYWNEIDQNLFLPPTSGTNLLDVLNLVRQIKPKIGFIKTLAIFGALILIQNYGNHFFRSYFGLVANRSPPWYRLKNELKIFMGSKSYSGYQALANIPKALNGFQPLKLAQFSINYNNI